MKLKTLFIFIIITFFIPNLSEAQNENLSMNGHIVKSSFNKKDYQLYISLPSNYNPSDTIHYPVLYILDANYSYPLISSLHNLLDSCQEIEKIIIVAIGDKDQSNVTWISSRMSDCTPSNDPNVDAEIANGLNIPKSEVKTGGAKEFLATIRTNIIPFINNNYKTKNDYGILGHSVGGLFAGYCLINAPDLFKRYGINSPSFLWNNQDILSNQKNFITKNAELNAKVFISYGSLEPEIMFPSINSFINTLEERNYKGLTLTTQIFENETHTSVVAASTSRALKVLYGVKRE